MNNIWSDLAFCLVVWPFIISILLVFFRNTRQYKYVWRERTCFVLTFVLVFLGGPVLWFMWWDFRRKQIKPKDHHDDYMLCPDCKVNRIPFKQESCGACNHDLHKPTE